MTHTAGPSAHHFKRLTFRAAWTRQATSDLGEEYTDAETYDLLTRLPIAFGNCYSLDLLRKLAAETSLHAYLANRGYTLTAIDLDSIRIVDLN